MPGVPGAESLWGETTLGLGTHFVSPLLPELAVGGEAWEDHGQAVLFLHASRGPIISAVTVCLL